jgi:hypothetical protein
MSARDKQVTLDRRLARQSIQLTGHRPLIPRPESRSTPTL